MLPLRVYLSASFVFFVGWALLPLDPALSVDQEAIASFEPGRPVRLRVSPDMTPAEAAARAEALSRGASAVEASAAKRPTESCLLTHDERCGGAERWLSRVIAKAQSMTFAQWKARGRALAPYAMLAMQPVSAALLLATFAGRGRRYAEHFVFSLHSHSLWFLALLLAMATGLRGPVTLAVFVHGLAAMRRVYGLSWWGAPWRGLALSSGYFVLPSSVALTLALMIAATA